MKRILLFAATLLVAVSCTENLIDEAGNLDNAAGATKEITLDVTLSDEPESRIAADNEWNLSWEQDDVLYAYYYVTYSNSGTYPLTISNYDAQNSTFSGAIDPEVENTRLVYTTGSESDIKSMTSYNGLDLTSQTNGNTPAVMVSDLVAVSELSSVKMQHVCAAVELKVTLPDTYEGYTLTDVTIGGFNAKGKLPLAEDKVIDELLSSSAAATISISGAEAVSSAQAASYRFSVLPTELAAGGSIAVMATLSNGTETYTVVKAITNTTTESVNFERATFNTINCTATAADIYEGAGTEQDPLKISSATLLRKLSADVAAGVTFAGKHLLVTENIDLGGESNEFTRIGSKYEISFQGVFDGNDKEITGLYINQPGNDCQGLFGCVNKATIKNTRVSGSVTGDSHIGGIVGFAYTSTISSCHNSATVTAETYNYVGGIAGYTSSSSKITLCSNSGTVRNNATGYAGGIVGCSQETIITYCYNSGDVSANVSTVGGIAGQIQSTTYGTPGLVLSCYNSGDVSSDTDDKVGGVVGRNDEASVVGCYNSGAVSGYYTYIGGVVGQSYSYEGYYNSELGYWDVEPTYAYVIACYNSGSVKAYEDVSWFGGVVGKNESTGYITSCYYNTDVDVSNDDTTGGAVGDDNGTITATEGKTAAEMQAAEFVTLLNEASAAYNAGKETKACSWKEVAGDFPTLDFSIFPTSVSVSVE